MQTDSLSLQGRKIIEDLAQRYGVSSQAVETLLQAVKAGNGTMAQFNSPELGGMGQWSQGGMTMVGDMFNNALKAKVNGLCSELANFLSQESHSEISFFDPAKTSSSAPWWGGDLGTASTTGSQNNMRYAYFPAARRLAVGIGDDVTIYDTQDHEISGVSQQQGGNASLTFSSQRGLVRVTDLPVVSPKSNSAKAPKPETTTRPNDIFA
jgi:hypothetical protein